MSRIEPGFTLIEFGFFVLSIGTAMTAGTIGLRSCGCFVGAIMAVVGFFLPFGLASVVGFLSDAIINWRPPRPACENGKCRWNKYGLNSEKFVRNELEWSCRCGKKYLTVGRRFVRLMDDGRMEPYKVLRGRRKAGKDEQAALDASPVPNFWVRVCHGDRWVDDA